MYTARSVCNKIVAESKINQEMNARIVQLREHVRVYGTMALAEKEDKKHVKHTGITGTSQRVRE